MNKEIGYAEMCAWLLAGLTIVASIIVVSTFATDRAFKEVSAPIIIWCIVYSIYAILYAILFSEVQKISKKSDDILTALNVQTPLFCRDVDEISRPVSATTVNTANQTPDASKGQNSDNNEPERELFISEVFVIIALGLGLVLLVFTNLT